jgi:hypothetical protein
MVGGAMMVAEAERAVKRRVATGKNILNEEVTKKTTAGERRDGKYPVCPLLSPILFNTWAAMYGRV